MKRSVRLPGFYSLMVLLCIWMGSASLAAREPRKKSSPPSAEKSVSRMDSLYKFLDGKPFGGLLADLSPDSVILIEVTLPKDTTMLFRMDITTVSDTAGKQRWRYLPLSEGKTIPHLVIDGQPYPSEDLQHLAPEQIRSMEWSPEDSTLYVVTRRSGGIYYRAFRKGQLYVSYLSGRSPDWLSQSVHTLQEGTRPAFLEVDINVFRTWVMSQLRYPSYAAAYKITGRVTVSFIVRENGTLDDIQIESSPDSSLSKEVIRVLKTSPPWTPGTKWGVPCSSWCKLPVDFNIYTK